MKTYTTSEAAKELRINADGVRARILSGELAASDISKPGSVRRKYRITEQQLREYLERKLVAVPARKSCKQAKSAVNYLD